MPPLPRFPSCPRVSPLLRGGALALIGLALLARAPAESAAPAGAHEAILDPAQARALLASGAPDPAAGRRLFQVNCIGCHGPNGEGGRGPTLAAPHLPRGTSEAAIARIIAQGIHGTDMPPFILAPPEVRDLAAWVWRLGQLPPEPVPGDPRRGAALYARGNCALCHSLRGYGGAIGPSLDDVGSRRGVAYLRRALVDPGADVPQSFEIFRPEANITANFLVVSLVTRTGAAWTGVRINEDAFSIQIRDFSNGFHSFLKAELAELHKEWGQSPMPSYAQAFTPGELDDLIAFLAARKGQP
jgi:mono/diheme cytochrome c family protein